ncbi:hypothetical protein [Negadavirga shengliensis]|uniref:Uncharacterized protein n=1 Tax=Negadavirga shengliensis TaxID=1389218 RepID=A0ABV9T802_9BACT
MDEKFLKFSIWFGLLLGSMKVYSSFTNFLNHAHLFGTEEQWRFYFSLISLLLFSGMLFALILVLVIRAGILKFNRPS